MVFLWRGGVELASKFSWVSQIMRGDPTRTRGVNCPQGRDLSISEVLGAGQV